MDHLAAELEAAVAAWDDRGWPRPGVALVSGSGLAVDLELPRRGSWPLQDLLPWSSHGVIGHPMEVEILEPPAGRPVVYYRGRLHAYQGYTPAQVVFLVRLAGLLGAHTLLMSNAAGAVDPALHPGDLVTVSDHINLTGLNPLRGEPPEAWGPRFPDMTHAYDKTLRQRLHELAAGLGISLSEGVYGAVPGPSYETPAEVRMLGLLGAQLVGMSTVLEVTAARHLGLRCAVLSLASNQAAGLLDAPLHHDEVLEIGRQAAARLGALLTAALLDPVVNPGSGD